MGEDRWGRSINQQTFHRHNGKDLPEGTLVLEPRATYDRAIVGSVEADGERVTVYRRPLLVKALMDHEEMRWTEAEEWVSHNTEGAYVGPGTPYVTELDVATLSGELETVPADCSSCFLLFKS